MPTPSSVWFSQHLWRTRSLGALSLTHYFSTGWLLLRVRGLHAPSALVTAAFACYPDLEKGEQAMEIDGIWDRECIKSLSFQKRGLRRLMEKPRPAASDRVVYLAVAPPIEPVIYSKEIFIPSDLILMIINRPRPLSVPLSGVYSRSWRLKLICTVSPCRFSGHIPRHLQRKRQRQRVAGSECTWFRLWVTVKGVSKSKCSWFSYKRHLFHHCTTKIKAFLMLRYKSIRCICSL